MSVNDIMKKYLENSKNVHTTPEQQSDVEPS